MVAGISVFFRRDPFYSIDCVKIGVWSLKYFLKLLCVACSVKYVSTNKAKINSEIVVIPKKSQTRLLLFFDSKGHFEAVQKKGVYWRFADNEKLLCITDYS